MVLVSNSLISKWKIIEVKLKQGVSSEVSRVGFRKSGDIKINLENKFIFEITESRFIEDDSNISDKIFKHSAWEFDETTKILKLKHILMNLERKYLIEETINIDELKFIPPPISSCGSYSGVEYFVVKKI